jgi:hypothetical protein
MAVRTVEGTMTATDRDDGDEGSNPSDGARDRSAGSVERDPRTDDWDERRRRRAVGSACLVVLALGVAAAFLGVGPVPGAGDAGTDAGVEAGTDPRSTATGSASDGDPTFAFAVEGIERCGRTCRDVTSTLTAESASASSVTVTTRIYAGNGTDGEGVWRGRERVGELAAGGSYTATTRVDLSLADALAVEGAGGWVTVRTTVRSTETTTTFTRRREVG